MAGENWVGHIQTEITDIIMYLLINKVCWKFVSGPKNCSVYSPSKAISRNLTQQNNHV